MAAQNRVSRHRVSGRLLLLTDLVVANAAAAVYVLTFLKPGFVGYDSVGRDTGPAMAFSGNRVAVLPLDTTLAWVVFAVCVALMFWNFAWLVRRRQNVPPSNWVVSETPSGPVRVAKEALEVSLQKAGEALPEVTRLRVQVDTASPKRILVTGQFQSAEGTSNLAASQRLRSAMVSRFAEMVRPLDGGRVEFDLEFQGYAGKLGKKAGEVPPATEAPFTGPKYPIDDESHGGLS
ncbi:MAG: hypothetical protein ABIP94_18425 [Planctomycetota bacterium]